MSASQGRQPTLDSVAPRFLVTDMEQALAFYGQLGFATPYCKARLSSRKNSGLKVGSDT